MPVVLRCTLCRPPADGLIVTTADPYLAAIDHALDEHRPALLADPDATERSIRISAPGRQRPVRRTVRAA
jgi:hypothetical protein